MRYLLIALLFSSAVYAREIKDIELDPPSTWKVGDLVQGMGKIVEIKLEKGKAFLKLDNQGTVTTIELKIQK